MSASATALDRAIGWISPSWALRRGKARAALEFLASSRYYDAAGQSRRTAGWKRPSGDGNAVSGVSLQRLRDAARSLVRNNGYARNAIQTIVDDTVGRGIWPFEGQNNELWTEWARTPQLDADGRHNLAGLQHMVMRTVVESGECYVRRRFRQRRGGLAIPLQIQVMEPDFIDTSRHGIFSDGRRIIRGIEFNSQGRRLAYYMFREHPGSTMIYSNSLTLTASVRVPASEVLQIMRAERPGQVRDASWFSPSLIRFNDFDEFLDATLMKQKIAALLSVITYDVDALGQAQGPNSNTNDQTWDYLEPGGVTNIAAGKNVEVINPPSVKEFPEYSRTTLQEIASGLGVTPEDLTGDYSQTTYSAARASRQRHYRRVDGWQHRMIVPQFCVPVWRWAMEAIELAGGQATQNDGWTTPPIPMIEPDKEGLAIMRNIRSGIQTPSDAIRERGMDPDRFLDQYQDDMEDLDRRGLVLDTDARKVTQQGQMQPSTVTEIEQELGVESNGDRNGNGNGEIPENGLLTVAGAAKLVDCSEDTIRKWIKAGAIPVRKVGPHDMIRIDPRDLMRDA